MLRYGLKRLAQAFVVILGVSFATFIVSHLTGAPVTLLAPETASEEEKHLLREYLGLDRPLLQQYVGFLARAAQGDLGFSYVQQTRVTELVLERLPATLELALVAFLLSLVIAIPL